MNEMRFWRFVTDNKIPFKKVKKSKDGWLCDAYIFEKDGKNLELDGQEIELFPNLSVTKLTETFGLS